jgi:hypothetical protein
MLTSLFKNILDYFLDCVVRHDHHEDQQVLLVIQCEVKERRKLVIILYDENL